MKKEAVLHLIWAVVQHLPVLRKAAKLLHGIGRLMADT